MSQSGVLILGCGFLGKVLAQRLTFKGIPVVGTARGEPQLSIIRTRGAAPQPFDGTDLASLERLPIKVDRVVMSIPPEAGLDEALAAKIKAWGIAPGRSLYLSTTSVYPDAQGGDVFEDTPAAPASPGAEARLKAEAIWQSVGASVLRPSGIYGPGRSILHRLAARNYRMIGEGDSIVNRIHVADLAALCEASLQHGEPGLWLGTDLTPVTQAEAIGYAVDELKLPAPAKVSLAEAKIRMDRGTVSMLTASKRLRPEKTLETLKVKLRYPGYREGFSDVYRRDKAQLLELIAKSEG